MKRLHFTQEQVTKILEEIAQKEGGYQEVLKISMEAMMRAEREEHNHMHGDMRVVSQIVCNALSN